jgi:hypothetical protein
VLGTTDWTDKADASRAIKDFYGQRELKAPLEERLATNCAFLGGRQESVWSKSRRQMVVPIKVQKQQDFLVYNIIKYMLSQKMSRFISASTCPDVSPFTSDESDQLVSRLSRDILRYYHDTGLQFPAVFDQFLRWAFASPVVWFEPSWDPMAGEATTITLDDFFRDISPEMTQGMGDQMREEDLKVFRGLLGFDEGRNAVTQYAGDLAIHIRTVFDVMWYPFMAGGDFRKGVHAYLVSTVMAPEAAAARFRKSIDEILSMRGATDAASSHYEKIIRNWTSPHIDMPVLPQNEDFGVLVHVLYADRTIRPPESSDDPGGITAVLIGDAAEALRVGPLDNALGVLPLFSFVEDPDNGLPWGTCCVDDAIPAQMELNDCRNSAAKSRRDRVRDIIVRSKNDGNEGNLKVLERREGVYVVNNMGEKPSFLDQPTQRYDDEEDTLFNVQHIRNVMANPDVSLIRNDGTNTPSGKAILANIQNAEQQSKQIGRRLNQVVSEVWTFCLAELQRNATKKRITEIAGDDGSREFVEWNAASIRPSIYSKVPKQCANIQVTCFTNMATTAIEKQQNLRDLIQLGALKSLPPGHVDRIVCDAFGLGDYGSVIDAGRAARDKAEINVQRWKRGQPVAEPQETDDHYEYVQVYKKFLSSDELEVLSAQLPGLAQEVNRHLEVHYQGVFDQQARDEMRALWAQMREAAKFGQQAENMGLQLAAMRFYAIAYGGVPSSEQPQSPGAKPNKQEDDQGQSANGGSGPQPRQAGPAPSPEPASA